MISRKNEIYFSIYAIRELLQKKEKKAKKAKLRYF